VKGRPADRLEPEIETARQELGDKGTSIEDVLSFALFPAVSRDFFDERQRGELKPEALEPPPEKGPIVAHELHLAPVEFNLTLHGESYHIRVSGAGRKKDGIKPYYIRVNEKLEEVYLEPLQEVLAGVPEAPDTGSATSPKRPKPMKPGDIAPPMPGRVVKVLVASWTNPCGEIDRSRGWRVFWF
jgi:pyruvate carboxylase subunit B